MDLDSIQDSVSVLEANIQSCIKGKPEVIRSVIVAMISHGHVLIEDVPGVGKTTLAAALAKSVALSFRRIQFTSDLLPSDILGVSIFDKETGEFKLKPGPIFTNVVLADEINRATPKSQSALLEAMSESKVSIDGKSYLLPKPFFVVATQNPFEYRGTFPLPENQLDRFAMRVSIGYPDHASEKEILLENDTDDKLEKLRAVISRDQLVELQEMAESVFLDDGILEYLLAIVKETRNPKLFDLGVSPRGAIALKRAAQARALIEGRNYCIPDDVKEQVVPVFAHRVIPKDRTLTSRGIEEDVLKHVLENISVPL